MTTEKTTPAPEQAHTLPTLEEDLSFLRAYSAQKGDLLPLDNLIAAYATLRRENDEYRVGMECGQQNCDDVYNDLRAERDSARKAKDIALERCDLYFARERRLHGALADMIAMSEELIRSISEATKQPSLLKVPSPRLINAKAALAETE